MDSATERCHRSHAGAYAPARIGIEHVAASAAIPLLWPPVPIEQPARARGWYADGGTRLNAPIKPALDLDSDRLDVVVLRRGVHRGADPDGPTGRRGLGPGRARRRGTVAGRRAPHLHPPAPVDRRVGGSA